MFVSAVQQSASAICIRISDFSGGSVGTESACNAGDRRGGLNPWVRKISWRRVWQPTPVFLPGKSQEEDPSRLQSMGSQRVGHDWPHFNLIASVWNLFPSKVTFWELVVRTSAYVSCGEGHNLTHNIKPCQKTELSGNSQLGCWRERMRGTFTSVPESFTCLSCSLYANVFPMNPRIQGKKKSCLRAKRFQTILSGSWQL